MGRILLIPFLLIFTLLGCVPSTKTILENGRNATVQIRTADISCSGFHIGRGFFISAAHCLGSEPTTILYDKDYVPADIRAVSTQKDIAILYALPISSYVPIAAPYELTRLYATPIATLGFPGYYFSDFMVEYSHIIEDLHDHKGTHIMIATAASYPGESGGPVISLENGKVIGMIDGAAEKIFLLGSAHTHKTLSILVVADEFYPLLKQAKFYE